MEGLLQQKKSGTTTIHSLISLLVISVAVCVYDISTQGNIDYFLAFWIMAAVVLLYSVVQNWLVYKNTAQLFYLNPIVHMTLVGNFLLLIVGGSVYFLPAEYGGYPITVTKWMLYWILLYLAGSIALWSGYWSRFAVRLSNSIRNSLFLNKVIRSEFRVNRLILWVMFVIGVACQLIQIKLGIFGYSRNPELAAAYVGLQQYLELGRGFIPFTLLVLSLQYFTGQYNDRRPVLVLVIVFVFSVFSGFLSGFKSQVVMPILIVGLAYYVVNEKLAKWVLPIGLILLFFAYSVIEPFRYARSNDPDFQSQSFFYIYETMFLPENPYQNRGVINTSEKVSHFVNSQFVIPIWAEGLRYYSENHGLPNGAPNFLAKIILAPLLAVVPRFIWPSKPLSNEGNWYYVHVLGKSGKTSVSVSIVTKQKFARSLLKVFLGFFFVGVLQRALFRGFILYGAGGIIIFLGLFSGLRGFNLYHAFLVNLIRYIPLLIILQYILLRHSKN